MVNESESSISFFRFEDLRIYAKALDYIKWVNAYVATMPVDAQKNVGQNFLKASQAIALNIAEGSARNKSQFVYYLKMAKSAVRECVVYTTICYNLEYMTTQKREQSRSHLMELTKMIGSLIASLQRSVGTTKDEDDD